MNGTIAVSRTIEGGWSSDREAEAALVAALTQEVEMHIQLKVDVHGHPRYAVALAERIPVIVTVRAHWLGSRSELEAHVPPRGRVAADALLESIVCRIPPARAAVPTDAEEEDDLPF
jgi:hypothetical protein